MLSHRKGVLLDGIGSELVRASTGGVRKTLSKWLGDLSNAINLGDVASTFTSGDATPSVLNNSKFITAGTTAITNFDDGVEGQTITVYRGASDISITDNATIDPIIAGDITLSTARPSATFRLASGVWKQVEEAGALSSAMAPVVQAATTASARQKFGVTGAINLMDPIYGAVGDGVTNDRPAFVLALADAISQSRALYVPGGYTFFYDGAGLTGAQIHIVGDGVSQSIIVLGAGKYLVDDSALWGSFHMSGLRIVDGAGAVRSTYTSSMVQLTFTVRDCYFYGYTGPCISNNSSDNPHWQIENCIFWGGDDTTCVGIALKGLTDSNLIKHNTFRKNKVAIKLGDGGNNAYLDFNDFVQYDGGSGRVAVHIVPDADGTNAGTGLYIGASNKFGNENIDSSDFRIVYADELSGTYFGDKLPDMSTNSTGYIRGHNIGGAFIGGGTNPQQPLIKSMTKRVFGCSYTNIAIGGTPPTYILEFSQTPDALTDSDPEWNLIGPVVFDGFEADDLASFAVASSYVSVRIFDPAGTLARLSAATAAATTTPFIKTGTWTPVLTFVTPGDVAVSYSVQLGDYVQVGQPGNGFIELNCVLTTSAFTHTTASGNLRITGLPVAAVTSSGRLFFGAGRFGGITKAGYTDFSPVIVQGTSIVNIAASGSGVATALVAHGDTPTGGTVVVQFSMRYFI